MTVTWSNPPSRAFPELSDAYVAAIRRGIRAIADRYAPEIEAHMKREAVWEDRTGNARQTLNTEVEDMGADMVTIILAHGVNYGVYLELSNQGRFAVIAPAIDIFAPRIWQDVLEMLR